MQAAVFNEPLSTITVKKQKMTLLADLANLDLPFPNTDYIVRREHRAMGGAQIIRALPGGVWVGGSEPRQDGCAIGY